MSTELTNINLIVRDRVGKAASGIIPTFNNVTLFLGYTLLRIFGMTTVWLHLL